MTADKDLLPDGDDPKTFEELADAAISDMRRYAYDGGPERRMVSVRAYEERLQFLRSRPSSPAPVQGGEYVLVPRIVAESARAFAAESNRTAALHAALSAALSSPLQGREPVAWQYFHKLGGNPILSPHKWPDEGFNPDIWTECPLYAKPPVQSVEVGLRKALASVREHLVVREGYSEGSERVRAIDEALAASPSAPEEWQDEELSPELEAIRRDTQAKIAIAMMGVYPTRKYHVSIRRLPAPPAAKGDEQ